MQADRAHFPRGVFLLAGFTAGALTRVLSNQRQAGEIAALRRSLAEMESRAESEATERERRLRAVETRLEEHETRLGDVPSTGQIVAAMEELLSKTMSSLSQRLATQADSIELLKTTVAQTDGLLERVIESLDALREAPQDSPDGASE